MKSESFEAAVAITIPKTNNYLKVKQAIEGVKDVFTKIQLIHSQVRNLKNKVLSHFI